MNTQFLRNACVIAVSLFCVSSFGQWLQATGGIYYSGGNVGIGTSAPAAKLHLSGQYNLLRFDFGSIYNDPNLVFNQNAYYDPSAGAWKRITSGTCSNMGLGSDGNISFSNDPTVSTGTPNWITRMLIKSNGNVGIGTSSPSEKLEVAGNVKITGGKLIVNNWSIETPDYVFNTNYQLPKISEVETFVKTNNHLPEVPSAQELRKNGIDVAEMNLKLLKKVEELTLYVIDQNKKIEALEKKISQ